MSVKALRMTDYEDQANTLGLVNVPELAAEPVTMASRSFESPDAISMHWHGGSIPRLQCTLFSVGPCQAACILRMEPVREAHAFRSNKYKLRFGNIPWLKLAREKIRAQNVMFMDMYAGSKMDHQVSSSVVNHKQPLYLPGFQGYNRAMLNGISWRQGSSTNCQQPIHLLASIP